MRPGLDSDTSDLQLDTSSRVIAIRSEAIRLFAELRLPIMTDGDVPQFIGNSSTLYGSH